MSSFPTKPEMLQSWINATPRKHLIVTKYTKICAKQFSNVDFEKYSVDQCQSKQQKRDIQQLKKIRLKHFAVSHI